MVSDSLSKRASSDIQVICNEGRTNVNAMVLARFSAASMPDNPSSDWHRTIRQMVVNVAGADGIDGEVRDVWWTLGPYDMVVVVDVPSPRAAAALSLTLSRKLRAETTTLTTLEDA